MRWRDLCLVIAIIMFVVAAFVFEGAVDIDLEAGTFLAIGLAFLAGSLLSEVVS